jgi:Dolichyl-phosphate-mannose-protein mannosyltransferase
MVAPPLPTLFSALLGILVIGGIVVIGRSSRKWTTYPSRCAGFLAGSLAPLLAGLVTALSVYFVWRSLHEPGVVHDERAYLLQAEIFSRGHWTAASPPLATFFEQMHVFMEPAVFAKYPPAHALTLVPGIWLGLPGIMPVMLAGLSGMLIFWLARRLANVWTALLTWWLWTTGWVTLYWSASYFSETTSTATWLVAMWATLRWRDTNRSAYLACVAAALAWGIMARPLTMAMLALPLGFVVIRRTMERREWASLAAPVLLGITILSLGPLWNHHTLGDWRRDPYSEYSRVYFPFDKPGFGVDPTPPLRALPPEIAAVGQWSKQVHESYVAAAVPRAALERVAAIVTRCADGWRFAFVVLILAGVLRARGAEVVGLWSIGLVLLAHLTFAHPSMWVVYYVELLPIVYFLGARELGRVLHLLARWGAEVAGRWPAPVANAALAVGFLFLPLGISDLVRVRAAVDQRNAYHRAAESALASLPSEKAIVFVRYPPLYNTHLALTRNEPDSRTAPIWVVYDRGPENAALRALAPDRAAYRLNTETMRIERLSEAAIRSQ